MWKHKAIKLNLIYQDLLDEFKKTIDFDPIPLLQVKRDENLAVDYFDFYNSVSSVYSSKIEGEQIEYDSFFKYKFLNVKYEPDYTMRSNDLYQAYEFINNNKFSKENLFHTHKLISSNLLPKEQRGIIRNNQMYVIGDEDKIEYVACDQFKLNSEFEIFLNELDLVFNSEQSLGEIFYYASMIHLVFVKIHPFQDGNGRVGRLLEKWFLLQKIGELGNAIGLEKNYFKNRNNYYSNIKKLGLEYQTLDYSNSLDFLKMTIESIKD